MAIRIIVDANPIISALIGGISRNVFFDKRFEFLTTEFTLNEVKKYIPTISKKSGINEEEINYALRLLPIIVVFREEYEKYILEAERWIAEIDKKCMANLMFKGNLWRKFPLAPALLLLFFFGITSKIFATEFKIGEPIFVPQAFLPSDTLIAYIFPISVPI